MKSNQSNHTSDESREEYTQTLRADRPYATTSNMHRQHTTSDPYSEKPDSSALGTSQTVLDPPKPSPQVGSHTIGSTLIVPAIKFVLDRVGAVELQRRLWHMLPGFLPFVLWAIYHKDPLSLDCRAWMLGVFAIIASSLLYQYHTIVRKDEKDRLAAVFGYSCPVMFCLLFIPGQAEIGLAVLGVLAFGDGSATLGGLLFRGPTLPWNRNKTWIGSLCFALVGIPMASVIYWGEANPSVSAGIALACGMFATIPAVIAESIDSRINDNLRVGVAAAIGAIAAQSLFVGW